VEEGLEEMLEIVRGKGGKASTALALRVKEEFNRVSLVMQSQLEGKEGHSKAMPSLP